MTLTKGVIENTSEVVGTVEAKDAITLKPEIDGRISDILVKEGDRIQKGQTLIRLDSSDWDAELYQAQAQLATTQARLAELQAGNRREDIDEAIARLNEAKARLANATRGSRPEEIAQAQAQLTSAIAEAELAQQRVGRYEQLKEQGAISADQYQEYNTQSRSATAAVEEAKSRLSQLQKSRGSDIDELAAAVERESQNVRRLQNGPRLEVIAQAKAEVAEARAKVRIAQVNLNKTQILAPISGMIGDMPIEVGDYVNEGDTLTTLTENNVLELNLSIPLEKASELQLGLPVELLDTQGKATATGTISFISPDVTSNSQLIVAKATFTNINRELLNRQFVRAKVIWEKRPGILIPATAVSRIGAQTFVFVAHPKDKSKSETPQFIAQQRQVELGSLQENNYQILKGVNAGEKIVTAGILSLRDGAPIQPLP
ncbi:efflux transporter, RND family protein [Aphanothece sacrum FPU1]|uniref:Efflux transporter, RND family protein n=2 Tax=Aphanothece sacrum TaxID=1122 RepID=A0A401INF8_APHSA|nr:efflux transporter, RND family protein [Aphanothece sacrum FPU1]GBF85791.1 Efflux transporter, RND family, MFP subunit [Aphanothece sacrum FPU3]